MHTSKVKPVYLLAVSLVSLLALLLAGCQGTPVANEAPASTPRTLSAVSELERANFHHALDMLEKHQPADAQPVLLALAENNPQIREYWLNLAYSHYQLQAYTPASVAAKKALEIDANTYQALNLLGLLALNGRQFDQAKSYFEAALAINASYANASYNLALLYDIYLQDINQAIKYYRGYLDVVDKDQATADWLAHLELSLGK